MRRSSIPPGGGIPPANRRQVGTAHLSTMRSAARRGMSHTDAPFASTRVFAPDKQAIRERQVYRQALAAKRDQLRHLVEDLMQQLKQQTDSSLFKELELVQEELARLEAWLG